LVKVLKRSGALEDFDQVKLEDSLAKAGASEENASKIARVIAGNVMDQMHTAELSLMAATVLQRLDKMAARRYKEFKKSQRPKGAPERLEE
jgi:transcriptional regulator NrdR family protein